VMQSTMVLAGHQTRSARNIRAFLVIRHRLALEAAAPRQQLMVLKRKQPRCRLHRVDEAFRNHAEETVFELDGCSHTSQAGNDSGVTRAITLHRTNLSVLVPDLTMPWRDIEVSMRILADPHG